MKQEIQIIINWERNPNEPSEQNNVIIDFFKSRFPDLKSIDIREEKDIINTNDIRRGCLLWSLEDVDLNAERLELDISNMTDDVKLSIIEEAIDDNNDSVCESINDSICSIIDRTLNGTKND